MPPDVTVVIPAYNSATTLARAVQSVLKQDSVELELLVVDDASTDGTRQIAMQFVSDARVRLIALSQNRGKAHAMNTAIGSANGRWIAVLDADDWYAPDRLSTLLAAGERFDAQFVADNQFIYDEGVDKVLRTALRETDGIHKLDKAAFIDGCDPYAEFDLGMLKPMIRAEFVRQTGLAYRENARLSEDFFYLLETFAAKGEGCLVARPMYYWRQAFGTLSRNWTGTGAGAWRYDFVSGEQGCAELLIAMQGKDESELVRLLEKRMRAFRKLNRMQEMNRLRANGGSLMQIATNVMRHPSVWPLIIQRGVRHVSRRAVP